MTEAVRTVLFICAHGAYRSRLAAAFFNAVAPRGWRGTSAGQEPQDAVSAEAIRLVAGTPAEPHLEQDRPRGIAEKQPRDRLVAIDCDQPGAERWTLRETRVGPEQRDEIRGLVERLAAELAAG